MIPSKFLPLAFLLTAFPALANPSEPIAIEHRVVFDQMTFLRPESDHRTCVWTDDATQIAPLLATFKIKLDAAPSRKGEILAVFFNENLPDKFVALRQDVATGAVLAEYKDTGIMFKLMAPPEGMKYAHITAVEFVPPKPPSGFGIAGLKDAGPVEKFSGKKIE